MDTKTTNDLLTWLKENLPEVPEEDLFKSVRRLQKVHDLLIDLSVQEFHKYASGLNQGSPDDLVDAKLAEIKEYIIQNHEKESKTKKIAAATAKLDLKKDQYQLVKSIKLDDCMDLISRYNRLISKNKEL